MTGDKLTCVLVTMVEVVEEEEGRESGDGAVLEISFARLIGEGAGLNATGVWFGEKGT